MTHAARGDQASTNDPLGQVDDVCEEELDEQLLLAELAASNVVGRRLPKKDLGWDKHLDE